MKKAILYLLFLSFTLSVTAQKINDEETIKTTLQNFFKGFHKGDVTLLKTTIDKNLSSQTTFVNGKGESVLQTDAKAYESLIAFARKVKPSDNYFEKILSYTIHIDGNLASVWTPYEFYINGVFSHCGSNSFQLFKNNGNWKIIYLVDTRRKENCNPSKK